MYFIWGAAYVYKVFWMQKVDIQVTEKYLLTKNKHMFEVKINICTP